MSTSGGLSVPERDKTGGGVSRGLCLEKVLKRCN